MRGDFKARPDGNVGAGPARQGWRDYTARLENDPGTPMTPTTRLSRALGLALLLPAAAQADVFINEIHYDNTGGDVGEAIEVVATAGEDLSLYSIVRYNGNGGASYGTDSLPVGTQVTCGAQVQIGVINYAVDGLQNGSPDGVALVGPGNAVIQFLSYEGTFTATNGPALGMLSVDIGVAEAGTAPIGTSLQLGGGPGSTYAGFAWNGSATQTFNACNNGQTFGAPVDNPPDVTTTVPVDGAMGVAVTTPIVVNFTETVEVDAAGITITCGAAPQPFAMSGGGASRTLTPNAALPFSSTCNVTVLASAVLDVDGDQDPMPDDFGFSFTTGIDNPPSLQSSTPANGAPDFPANQNLAVTFSEPVTVGASWFTIACPTSGNRQVGDTVVTGGPTSYTINPNADFSPGETCTLQLAAAQILDTDGTPDPLSGPSTVTFTAAAVVTNPPPAILTTRPLANAADFPPAAELRVQFSEPVTLAAGAFALSCASSTGIVLGHAGSGSDFYIGTGTSLVEGDDCTLTVTASAITDAGGANPTGNASIPFTVKIGTPAAYYASVNAVNAGQLRCTLNQVIRGHVVYPYTATGRLDTWDVLKLADEDPNNSNNILDAYRNASYVKAEGGNSFYNREHTWPNSLGFPSDTLAAYTDTHMLYLTDIGYNSDRGNSRYENCPSGCTERVTLLNNGVGGGMGTYPGNSNWFNSSRFEVWNARKGDMARAVMYMAIRYEGGDNLPNLELTDNPALIVGTPSSAQNAYMGLLATLIAWHQGDPPDALELARNQLVFSFQGNRNPFIDRPEWGTAALFQSTTPAVCEPLSNDPLIFADGFEP